MAKQYTAPVGSVYFDATPRASALLMYGPNHESHVGANVSRELERLHWLSP